MKLGGVFPQTEIGNKPEDLVRYAQGLEELGYDYLLTYDHILGADESVYPEQKFIFTYKDAFHEPMVLFAYLAAMTRTLEFVTGILVLPQRGTALVAKQATQVSLLSGGRLRLGVGVGWNRPEYDALGADFSRRGRRMDEQLEVLERLWTEELLDFEGAEHRLKSVGLNPLPAKPVPLWLGGYADAVFRRAARYGQGWMPATLPEGKLPELVERLHRHLEQAGRDPESFGLDGRIAFADADKGRWSKELESWRQVGATHLRCNTMNCGFATVDQHLEALGRFRDFLDTEKP